ncbi:MAG: patatin-like phospholipase family protein [Syntrophobacteraceae bacterium]|jgi:NTE family protein|nr:patatin-like phospholipase family protein [Syntrophobacteraceae bacterium]
MSGSRFKLALALSGGSARALTHVGVLRELQRHRLGVDLIVGTSMGAVVGGLFAYYQDVDIVGERLRVLIESDLFMKSIAIARDDRSDEGSDGFFHRFLSLFRKGVSYGQSMRRPALISDEDYQEIMEDLMPDCLIEDLPIPFAAVAMDILSGEEVVIRSGSLRLAAAASAAIPGLLPPMEYRGCLLLDGGWLDNVPVAPAIALGGHFVLAADASLDVPGLGPLPSAAIEYLLRCNEITRIRLMQHRKQNADVTLVPELGKTDWSQFTCLDRCSMAGSRAFAESLPYLRGRLLARRCLTLNGWLHPVRRRCWRHPFKMV